LLLLKVTYLTSLLALLLNVYDRTDMTRRRTSHEDIVLFRKYLNHLQALDLHTVATHTAGHANTLHNAGSVGRVTQRTRGALTVMLTVRLLTNPVKPMTLNDPLKALAFGSAYDIDLVAFGENVDSDGFTEIFLQWNNCGIL